MMKWEYVKPPAITKNNKRVKWEYATARPITGKKGDTTILKTFGKYGWELVSIENKVAYFKRPIDEEAEQENVSAIEELKNITRSND